MSSGRNGSVLALALMLGTACDSSGNSATDGETTANTAAASAAAIPAAYVWVDLQSDDPALDAAIARHVERARTLNLVPFVHLRTRWNTGGTLREYKDDPLVQDALRGKYLIELEVSIDAPAGPEGDWTDPTGLLCGNWAQTLISVAADGAPGKVSGSPGKFGPDSAAENAAMLHAFSEVLRRDAGVGASCVNLSFATR